MMETRRCSLVVVGLLAISAGGLGETVLALQFPLTTYHRTRARTVIHMSDKQRETSNGKRRLGQSVDQVKLDLAKYRRNCQLP